MNGTRVDIMGIQIPVSEAQIAEFCQRNRIRRFSFFGSVLRTDFRPDSDIDILVEFEPDAHVNYFMFVDMQDDLAQLLNHKIDLHTPESLSPSFRQAVIKSAEVIYERARQFAVA